MTIKKLSKAQKEYNQEATRITRLLLKKELKEPERIRGVFAPNYPRKVLWKGKPENRTTDTIIIKRDEYSQSFIATIPELDGLSAFGNTPELALKELNIAKRLFLEVMKESAL